MYMDEKNTEKGEVNKQKNRKVKGVKGALRPSNAKRLYTDEKA